MTGTSSCSGYGRPIRRPETFPTPEGTVVAPSVIGGTNWFSPAYSPRTGLFYLNAFDGEAEYFIRDEKYQEGEQYTGGGMESPLQLDHYQSAIRALDPTTGDQRWEFPLQPRSSAGILATAGDLIFSGGTDGYFFALDDVTGEPLWYIGLGRAVKAAPITYAVNAQQHVTVAVGNVVYTFALDE